jgi:hypothetical protein
MNRVGLRSFAVLPLRASVSRVLPPGRLLRKRDGRGDGIDHLARQGASQPEPFTGDFTGSAMQVDGGAGGFEAVHFLPKQRAQDAAEDIAGASL